MAARSKELGGCRIVEGIHEVTLAPFGGDAQMNEISEIKRLLAEAEERLKTGAPPDTRKAAEKLERVAALVTTLALTLRSARR